MPDIEHDQFETQVFPLLSVLALRNDLKEKYLRDPSTLVSLGFDPKVLAACQPIVAQNQASFLGVYGTMMKLQANYDDQAYDFPDCPTNASISKVVETLNQTAAAPKAGT